MIQESDISTAPQFSPGTPYLGFFDAKLNDSNLMLVVASVDDPGVAGTVDRAIVRIQMDAAGGLLSEQVVAKEGDILAQQTNPVADFGTGPHQSACNNAGQALFFADLAGPTDVDGAIYLDDALVAQEGAPAPVTGRNYEFLSGRGMDLNRHGQLFFKANIDGPTQDDEMLVRNGQVFIRERDTLPGLGLFTLTGFGTGSGPVQIDDNGNLLWYGDWNDPNTDVDTGLFLNTLLLVQEGVTMIGGQLVDSIANGADAFAISDNGRYIVFEATLQNGSEGAFLIEIVPPSAVPDGGVVPGTPMTAGRNANGVDIDVTWDVATCVAEDYHLLYGDLSDVSSYGYAGAACGLGTAGQATVAPPAGDVFWVIVAVDAMGFEGTHGFDGNAAPRPASAGGLCAVAAQVSGSSCPP